LKEFALKPLCGMIRFREADTRRQSARRAGEKHAPATRHTGLRQEALAHHSGINRTYLSSVERSERNVSIDNIARIARGLQIEARCLLKED
jgi:hypothetical protein